MDAPTRVRIKRIYDAPDPGDGRRVLVDRLWPRGVSKERAALDRWLPDVAPSTELRKGYCHADERWDEFRVRYRAELQDNPQLGELRALADAGDLTLLYGSRDETHNQAVVLAEVLTDG
jgi:uncharacterized protein YeaO (DUF488 family)